MGVIWAFIIEQSRCGSQHKWKTWRRCPYLKKSKKLKKKIEKANIPSLADLQEVAQIEGVELIACKMTVDMMEIDETKLSPGVVVWTAEDFMRYAKECKVCLFTYDNDTAIVHSLLPHPTQLKLVVKQSGAKLWDLVSGEETNGNPRDNGTAFELTIQPHTYRVLRWET